MRRLVWAVLLSIATQALADAASDLRTLQAQAQAGKAEAQFEVAEAYRSGKEIQPNLDLAIMWYRRAAAQGHIRASEELGFALFANGDRREAIPYIEKAAARGEPRAFYLLGTAHFNGDYVPRDWPLAYAQTTRAAAAGLSAAQRNLELMGRYLQPADRAKADQILATLPPLRMAQPRLEASAANEPGQNDPVATQSVAVAKVKPIRVQSARVTASPAPAASTPSGTWKVQLGAFGSADRARASWQKLSAKVTPLNDLKQVIVPAGSVQRLQVAGIESRTAAQTICNDVRAAGGDCLIIGP